MRHICWSKTLRSECYEYDYLFCSRVSKTVRYIPYDSKAPHAPPPERKTLTPSSCCQCDRIKMCNAAIGSTRTSFLSLPRELRDQIYRLLLVSHDQPIYFDSINGFMPIAKSLQSGILLRLCEALPCMVVELLETFYKYNHFIVKCTDIPNLMTSIPSPLTTNPLAHPKTRIMRLTVLVGSVILDLSSTDDPNNGLRQLLGWGQLHTAIIEIRGSYKAAEELCDKVIDIAMTCDELKKKLGPGLRVRVNGQPCRVNEKTTCIHTKADVSGLWSPPAKMEWHQALSAEENKLWWHVTNMRNLASMFLTGELSGWQDRERHRVLGHVCEFYSLKRRFYLCPDRMETSRGTTEGYLRSDPKAVLEAYADGDIPPREAKLRFSEAGSRSL